MKDTLQLPLVQEGKWEFLNIFLVYVCRNSLDEVDIDKVKSLLNVTYECHIAQVT